MRGFVHYWELFHYWRVHYLQFWLYYCLGVKRKNEKLAYLLWQGWDALPRTGHTWRKLFPSPQQWHAVLVDKTTSLLLPCQMHWYWCHWIWKNLLGPCSSLPCPQPSLISHGPATDPFSSGLASSAKLIFIVSLSCSPCNLHALALRKGEKRIQVMKTQVEGRSIFAQIHFLV